MAIHLKEKGIHDFIILEKAESLGGTWRENTYPGAECDIPSALYSYSFESNPDWDYKWSHQDQILAYMDYCADKYGIKSHIRYNKELISAHWDDGYNHWTLTSKDQSEYKATTFIPAIGQLHHPSTPSFSNQSSFQGSFFHSARWDHDIDLTNRRVGVIGNAASAIQFIPEIAKKTSSLIVFQRSANWVIPKVDRPFSTFEKKVARIFPFFLKWSRLRIWLTGGALYLLLEKERQTLRRVFENYSKRFINKNIDEPETRKKLIPTYKFGAKRVLFSDNYFKAINRENVHLETDEIVQFTSTGIETQNKHHSLDHIIYATGFKANPFMLGLDIRGRQGIRLNDAWSAGPKNYLGMTVDGFPNMFMMYGPNTNLGHSSIIIMSEAQSKYITQCIQKIKVGDIKSIEVKESTLNTYYDNIQERLKKMIWNTIEKSWYRAKNGNLSNNYPGRTLEYIRLTKKVNFNDYNIN